MNTMISAMLRVHSRAQWRQHSQAMTRIYNTIQIDKPVEQVFDYVTTAANWLQWHPSSIGVTGAADHPGNVGEQVTEQYVVAGNRGTVVWTVRERDCPRHWVIDGVLLERRGGGTVAYTLTAKNGGTFFEREFAYPTAGLFFRLIDALIYRRRVQAESEQALRNLKRKLESDE
jgi:uncharacterized protein YndB with AHSA1/START domain